MKTYKNIALTFQDTILTITIDRASKMNSLTRETMLELKDVFLYLRANSRKMGGIIITGAGEKAFAAGADISEFIGLDKANAEAIATEGQEIFRLIEQCHTPVIALVNGFALGGGCELAMAAHIRVAVATAKFGQPEVNLGLIPGYGGTQRLTQLIGKGKAFEYLLSADMIPADEAKTLGLVNHVAADKEAAYIKAVEILNKIATKAPIAIGLVIDSVNAYFETGVDGYQKEAANFALCFETEDYKEGVAAFIEKRKANFKGK